MPNNIVTNKGEYLQNFFKNDTGTWKLVSTETGGRQAIEAIDTFKNIATGKYYTKTRQEVFNAAEKKIIWINKPLSIEQNSTDNKNINLFS